MKGFKNTGNGPRYGEFKFPADKGFSGSTGQTQQVRGYTRAVPQRYAQGGFVQSPGGNALVKRINPVTEFDAKAGGKGPLRPGFAGGGKVSGVADALQRVKRLMSQHGLDADAAASRVAAAQGTDKRVLMEHLRKTGHASNPQMLRGGGPVFRGTLPNRAPISGGAPLRQGLASPMRSTPLSGAVGQSARVPMGPGRRAFADGGKVKAAVRKAKGSQFTEREYNKMPKGEKRAIARKQLGSQFTEREADRLGLADGGKVGKAKKLVRYWHARASDQGLGKGGEDYPKRPKTYKKLLDTMLHDANIAESEKDLLKMADDRLKGEKYSRKRGYADGGSVSKAEAKKIAERTVGEHVKYPAPQGHAGFKSSSYKRG